jgi:hypothetical protein
MGVVMKHRFEKWIHVKITNPELVEKLDVMSISDQRDRSKFLRWLIQQEWNRRNLQTHLMAERLLMQDVEKVEAS